MFLKKKKKVVVIGGGTGTYTVLSGLKKYTRKIDITAIVAMTDSGGSTGRLRDEFGYLPVGDVRMALVALAKEGGENEALLRKLFLHRFNKGSEVGGHNFGNLLLVALTDILGSEEQAIEAASDVLRVSGKVIPVTKEKTQLVAEYDDGVKVTGEHEIDEPQMERNTHRIRTLSVIPRAAVNPKAKEALESADMVIFGPGDLYTSILANCVVDGFAAAISGSKGKLVFISNLMTKVGQTTGMGALEHVRELEHYIGRKPDCVLVNVAPMSENLIARYAEGGEFPVVNNIEKDDTEVIAGDLVAVEEYRAPNGDALRRSLIRHDPSKLAETIIEML